MKNKNLGRMNRSTTIYKNVVGKNEYGAPVKTKNVVRQCFSSLRDQWTSEKISNAGTAFVNSQVMRVRKTSLKITNDMLAEVEGVTLQIKGVKNQLTDSEFLDLYVEVLE